MGGSINLSENLLGMMFYFDIHKSLHHYSIARGIIVSLLVGYTGTFVVPAGNPPINISYST